MNNPKSNSLFHFTKSSDILKSILKNGIYPRFCLEDAEWYVNRSEEHAAGAMSCFCDIPLSRITEHTNFYGQYGVGLTKQWGVKNGLNPVIYFPKKGIVPNIANYLIELARENDNLLYNKEYINQLTRFVRIIKPMSGKWW